MSGPAPTAALEFACFSAHRGRLHVLVRAAKGRGGIELPWVPLTSGKALTGATRKFVAELLGSAPAWIAQVTTLGDGGAHPSGLSLTIVYSVVVASPEGADKDYEWIPLPPASALPARQGAALEAATVALRERMDLSPVAFRLLPPQFTLSELQGMYELLLGRRLHKASFRRALLGAGLVAPTDDWRSEGRGRPAQLFRYAPRRRGPRRRPVRFDLLG